MEEIFLPVKDFESRFIISNYGNLISINGKWKGEKILYPHTDSHGYLICQLRMKPKSRLVRIHTLVAETFLIKPFHNACVNHKDGNKKNNFAGNLEWITIGENVSHSFKTGLRDTKGTKHPMSKLNEENVKEIRQLYSQGNTQQYISDRFQISRRHISDIVNGICWGWLT